MKSGEKIEGKIVKETPADYTIDFKAGGGIFDTRTVLKTDVEKVEKETPDDLAWQSLKNLQAGASSLPATGYEQPMRQLQAFITQYPQSPHAAEAAQALMGFEADKKRVDEGEVKIDGQWLSKDEVQKERYQINGRAIFSYMQELARKGDLVGALNAFDTMEKQYPGASVYPDAATFARALVDKLKATADQMLTSWKTFRAERETATKNLPDAQRLQTAAAQKAEQTQLDLQFEASIKSGVKWPPLQKQHEKTLSTISAKAQTELTRLGNLQVAKMRQSLQLTEQAKAEFGKQNLELAEPTIREATKLWTANELATRLTKEIAAAKSQAKIAATPVRVVAATPVPRATPAPAKTVTAATPAPETPAEQPKNFFTTPRGLGVIGIVVLVVVLGLFKKKKRVTAEHLG